MILHKYKGGESVGRGTYWDLRNGTRVDVDDSSVLPGSPIVTYRKMSPLVMLVVAPFAGLFYVIALPFVAIGTVLFVFVRKLPAVITAVLGLVVAFTWRPARAYLLGRKKKNAHTQRDDQDDKQDS
jgi:hypothetical protein